MSLPVRTGKIKEPAKILIYSPEGFGKSTLLAHAPDPVFIDADAGSGQLDVPRFLFRPDDELRGHVPLSYEDILHAVRTLRTAEHKYQTVVFDTIDVIEKMIHAYVVKRDGASPDGEKEQAPGIESYGFGRGYTVALDEARNLFNEIELLRTERRMTIGILGQMSVRKFEPPTGQGYERYEMRVHKSLAGFLREWCHIVGFGHFDDHAEKLDKKNKLAKAKGFDTGRRLIEFRRKATHDAKSRYALPDTIELTMGDPWAPFAKALSDAQNMTVDQLIEAIQKECERVGDPEVNKNVEKYVTGRQPEVLHEVLSQLREKQSKEEANNE